MPDQISAICTAQLWVRVRATLISRSRVEHVWRFYSEFYINAGSIRDKSYVQDCLSFLLARELQTYRHFISMQLGQRFLVHPWPKEGKKFITMKHLNL